MGTGTGLAIGAIVGWPLLAPVLVGDAWHRVQVLGVSPPAKTAVHSGSEV